MVTPAQAREIIHEWMFASRPALETGAKAIDALRDLASQVESLQADSERFRWLRDNSAEQWEHPICVEQFKGDWGMRYVGPLIGQALEKKIDEARKQS